MPGDPVILDTFGGIVAVGRPEDTPEGASPRNNDVDFIVGRVMQRPGLRSVYSNTLTEFGPEGPTVAADVDTESMPWTNPNNILSNDGNFTTIALLGQIGVGTVSITQGGYYALTETPTISFSGTGSGAAATLTVTTVTPPSGPQYKKVTGVTVTASGSYTGTITVTFSGAANPTNNATGTVNNTPAGQQSDNLRITGFGLAIPSNYQIKGIGLNIKGFASNGTVYAQMLKGGVLVGAIEHVALPTSNGFVSLGGSSDLFNASWLYTDIDSPTFGCEIWVTSPDSETVSLDYAEILIYGTPANADYTGIAEANLNGTDQTTIALDGNGLHWKEDVTNAPRVLDLESAIPTVTPGTKMKGIDADGVAYLAYSDMTQGTSQPMQFNGDWCDRITQVGPGVAPVFTPQQSSSDTFPITQITQPAPAQDPFGNNFYGGFYFLQSSGPGSTAPGNVVTIYYGDTGAGCPQNADLASAMASGFPVYLYLSTTGTPTTFGPQTIQVASIGLASPPGQPRQFYYLTFVTSSSAYLYYQGSGHTGYEVAWTRTLATLQATNPVPGLTVGNQGTVSGATPVGWNASWVISQALDSGAFEITSTSVTSGVATYNYALQSGAAPAVGELVTITNTTNANGALNVTNATIVTASGGSPGSFTVNVPVGTDYPSSVESGQGSTAGTRFCFDPGALVVGTATNPIYGNTTVGGSLTFSGAAGQNITAGTKQGSVFFITRNGAVTRPAPPVTFTVPSNCGAILVTHIPVGPPNVVARGITFTESGQNGVAGANFYYYDTPESFYINGTKYTSDALIVRDNTSTSATFSFSDAVLLASDEIDIPGNNYFNLIELGNPAWMFQYADRMMYGLCQTKIQNLINMSFDGGYQPTYSSQYPMPAGWTALGSGNIGSYSVTAFQITSNVVSVTAVNSLQPGYSVIIDGLTTGTYLNGVPLVVDTATGTGFTASFAHADVAFTSDSGTVTVSDSSIGLVTSLDFGNAFRMTNLGSSAWTNAQVLFQSAYQDYKGVNIVWPNVPYSVRVKARAINANGLTATIQLPTYSSGGFAPTLYGSASLTFDQGIYQTKTAPLITGNGLTTVPANLVLALGVSALPIDNGIEVDRIEIFPTNNPVDATTIWTSYAGKLESVDIVTGQLGVGAENAQPATGAFEILEQLYIEKTNSLQVTQDSPNYEPYNWQVRQTSDRAGAVGPNAFDEGEEFALSASRNGVYYFDGGRPTPILRELQSTANGLNLWETINWSAGNSIWLRNDLNNRRLYIGVPMITPNFWLPKAPTATPSSPNVVLMCNYTGCPTGEELANSGEVHVTMFGDLKAVDMRRKWSIWQIPSVCAEFIPRQDGFSDPLFIGNSIASSKIYQLIPGAASGGQNTDDGAAINWSYTTYGFVKAKQGQQNPMLGALRKVWTYLTATMEGVGQVSAKLYSNSLGALPRNTFTIPLKFTLSYPQQDDQERNLEIGGQRVFVEFSSVGTGGYAEIGPVTLDGEMDKNAPHRGVAS